MRKIVALVPLGDTAMTDPFAAVAAAAEIAARHRTQARAVLLGRPEHLDDAATQAAGEGAAEIDLVAHAALGDLPSVEHLVFLFESILAAEVEPLLLLLPAGTTGEEIAARLASRLDAAPLGRCTSIAVDGATVSARRAVYGGKAEVVLTSTAPRCLVAMRRPASHPVPALQCIARRIASDVALPREATLTQVVPAGVDRQRRVDQARIVVSGGRGMGGPDGFALLRDLATLLGAATGASLPAVDAGWASVSQQVGQSGAFVAPELYLAVGMSGTPQHLAGIALHSRIIAINSDPEAEIFRVAELGIAAPWQEVLPRLIERMRGT